MGRHKKTFFDRREQAPTKQTYSHTEVIFHLEVLPGYRASAILNKPIKNIKRIV